MGPWAQRRLKAYPITKQSSDALYNHQILMQSPNSYVITRFLYNHPRDKDGNKTSGQRYMKVREEAFTQLVVNMTTIEDNRQQIKIAEKTINYVNCL